MEFLKKLPNTVPMSIQQVSIVGSPDLLVCIYGKFLAIELKASATAPIHPMQIYNLRRIAQVGRGTSMVIYPECWLKSQQYLSAMSEGDMSKPEGQLLS